MKKFHGQVTSMHKQLNQLMLLVDDDGDDDNDYDYHCTKQHGHR